MFTVPATATIKTAAFTAGVVVAAGIAVGTAGSKAGSGIIKTGG